MDKGKVIRYSVIGSIYNLFLSALVYIVDWVNDEFFQFQWQNWDLASWWLFIASNLVIFGVLLFLAPYFERLLYYKLDKIQKRLNKKEK
ncbi:unnamed protein product [marine sediment metagenome]|uniref:Uncharacterized protein n=1 Tax=marine sediment metagenome TaxID=412755 RepID=X1F7E7_9ZZZZ